MQSTLQNHHHSNSPPLWEGVHTRCVEMRSKPERPLLFDSPFSNSPSLAIISTNRRKFTSSHFQSAAGFTILEVLIAMGIFVIGVSSVFAIFYGSAILQKNAVENVRAHEATRDATAFSKAFVASTRPEWQQKLNPFFLDSFVSPLVDVLDMLDNVLPVDEFHLNYNDHSYPLPIISLTTPADVAEDVPNRKYYWELLVMRRESQTPSAQWTVFLAVVRTWVPAEAENPALKQIRNAADLNKAIILANNLFRFHRLAFVEATVKTASDGGKRGRFRFDNDDRVRPGELLLTDNGLIYRAREADPQGVDVHGMIMLHPDTGEDPTGLWYCERLSDDDPSRIVDIIPFNDLLVSP